MKDQDILKKIWKSFTSNGVIDKEANISEEIRASWQRAYDCKVHPYKCRPTTLYSGEALEKHLNKNRNLIDTASPIIEKIYAIVKDARFIISLADNQGCLLYVCGDHQVQRLALGYFRPGMHWVEETIGSNGIGTPLIIDKPIQISGCEHYWYAAHKWTCSGAPIHDSNGKIIGVLDISAPFSEVHPHTLGMVVIAVDAIENQLRLQKTYSKLALFNNYRKAIIESISDGVVAIDPYGKVREANALAAHYFGLEQKDLIGNNYVGFLGKKNKELISLIETNQCVTDFEININTIEGRKNFLITIRAVNSGNYFQGTLLLFSELARARDLVQKMSGLATNKHFGDLIGKTAAFVETIELAKSAAYSRSNVLLLGESGTGKDIFAQAIHNGGNRKQGPFVALNCGAIPRELIASELFGYVERCFYRSQSRR